MKLNILWLVKEKFPECSRVQGGNENHNLVKVCLH